MSKTTLPRPWAALATALLATACGTSPTDVSHVLCPTCDPKTGGETGDLGGLYGPCHWVMGAEPIDATEAAARGFDVEEIERRLARGIQAPLRWQLRDVAGAEEVTGYEERTQIVVSFSAGQMTHMRTDPSLCKDGMCSASADGMSVVEGSCPHFLKVVIQVELETLDGALRTTAEGEAVQWAEGFEEEIGEGTASQLICHAYADLSVVEGNLTFPEPPFEAPYHGELGFSATLEADGVDGALFPKLYRREQVQVGISDYEEFTPLNGFWGEPHGEGSGGSE